ncbi:hypothetical protein A9W99_04395 [Mycobacterium sp. 1164966.3]|uniref:DUF2567 domain-containing protein n=1 Tax=Mycobacterium sp. 1164966.3 TaxID=1856861 RepID=UPI000801C45A|nr:hypothetical protein A9W99_04395 [Mycobacterium sp. 1164966.3]
MTGYSAHAPAGGPQTSPARAATIVAVALAASGLVIGGLWAWIAPPIHAVVAITRSGERVHDYLGTESQHFFVAPTLLIGLFTVIAVVAPVLLWQWREQRGPHMVLGLLIGLVTAVAVAAAVGAVLVRLRYGELNFDAVPLSGEHRIAYVIQAPPVFYAHKPLQMAATLLWPAATACLVYAVFAAASARDDLGGLPVADQPAATSAVARVQPEAPEGAVS